MASNNFLNNWNNATDGFLKQVGQAYNSAPSTADPRNLAQEQQFRPQISNPLTQIGNFASQFFPKPPAPPVRMVDPSVLKGQGTGKAILQARLNKLAQRPVDTRNLDTFAQANLGALQPFANLQQGIMNPPQATFANGIQNPLLRFLPQVAQDTVNMPLQSIRAGGMIGQDINQGTTTPTRFLANAGQAAILPISIATLGQGGAVASAGKVGLRQAVTRGAITGGIGGGALGTAQGLSEGANMSLEQQVLHALGKGAISGAIGAGVGGATGALGNLAKGGTKIKVKAQLKQGNMTNEQYIEKLGGWKPGLREKFDKAILNGDTSSIKNLLPDVPEGYKAKFATEIRKALTSPNYFSSFNPKSLTQPLGQVAKYAVKAPGIFRRTP